MSKKIVYIKLIIVTICLLFICWFIFLFSSILKPVNIDSAIEETIKNEDKIVFDLRKTPKQKKKRYMHIQKNILNNFITLLLKMKNLVIAFHMIFFLFMK